MLFNATRSQRNFLRKLTLSITILLFLMLILYTSFHKIMTKLNDYLSLYNRSLSKFLLKSGLSIDKVVLTGNKFTDERDILFLIDKTRPITYVSLSELANKIQSTNKWIQQVRIYRILPTNTLHVDIDECMPFCGTLEKRQ